MTRPALRHMLGRVGQAALVVWGSYTLTFAILFLLPADPVRLLVGPQNPATPGQIAALRREFGLDKPWWERYGSGLVHAVQGDFGRSVRSDRPVTAMLAEALPPTIELTAAALILGAIFGFALGSLTAVARAPWLRLLLQAVPSIGLSLPTFWLGVLALSLFSFHLGWFPAQGDEGLSSLVLPAATLAVPAIALLAQTLSASLVEAMDDAYVETARAHGASRMQALRRHALRNAAMPTLTMTALLIGWMLSGSVVVETVFSRDGIGRLISTSVAQLDTPVVLGIVTFATVAFTLANLLVEIAHVFVDPRVARHRPLSGATTSTVDSDPVVPVA